MIASHILLRVESIEIGLKFLLSVLVPFFSKHRPSGPMNSESHDVSLYLCLLNVNLYILNRKILNCINWFKVTVFRIGT